MTGDTSLEQNTGKYPETPQEADDYLDGMSTPTPNQSHINVLPPDILRLIFEYITFAVEGHRRLPWELEWMKNTAHVCAFWRCVALDHAALWTHIDFNAPSWVVEEKLSRSKVAPLTVIIDMSRIRTKDLGPVWKHTSRIRELTIISESDYRNAWTPVLIQNTLPDVDIIAEHLHTFSLTFRQGLRPNDSLPLNIFAGGTPKLRKLHLKRCDINWNSPFLAGLTTLHLDKSGSKTGRPSLTQFTTALGEMSNLEMLVLHNTLPLITNDDISNLRKTRILPRLSSIDITATTAECLQVLDIFAFPKIASAKFKVKSWTSEFTSHYTGIMTNMSSLAKEDGLFVRHPIRSIDCQYLQGYHGLEIGLWESCNDHSSRRPRFSARLQLSLHLTDNYPRLWQVGVLNSLGKIVPLEYVQSLSLSQLSSDDWSRHIDQFNSLEWLYARDTRTSYEFMKSLCQQKPPPLHREPREAQLYLPVLKGFTIEDCTFIGADETQDFGTLLHCLKTRVHHQQPLARLRLVRCAITNNQSSLLKEVVADVIIE